MKTMIVLDFMGIERYLARMVAVTVPVFLISSFLAANPYTMPTALAATIPLTSGLSLVSIDEKNDWESLRLALPISRTKIIAGRYATCLILALLGMGLGLVIYLLSLAIATAAPGLPGASQLAQKTAPIPAIAAPCIGAALGLGMLAFMLPGAAKYGATKATMFVPPIAIALLCFGIALAGGGDLADAAESLFDFALASPSNLAIIALATCAVLAVIYTLSCALTCRLYRNREF